METIAVYWESRVKVYSITVLTDLTLVRIIFPAEKSGLWGSRFMRLESVLSRFELVIQDRNESEIMETTVLFSSSMREDAEKFLGEWLDESDTSVTFSSPLEMVFLHGPHFQDRFGIVETAFSALQKEDIDIVAAGCAGTTIYLVVAEKIGNTARTLLANTFVVPSAI